MTTPQADESQSWLEYSGTVGGLLLVMAMLVFAQRVHRLGNRQTRSLTPDSPFAHWYVAVSFTLLPASWGVGFGLVVALSHGLDAATGAAPFRWLLLTGGAGMLACFGWMIKEYLRPSRWREVPEWIYAQGLLERPPA